LNSLIYVQRQTKYVGTINFRQFGDKHDEIFEILSGRDILLGGKLVFACKHLLREVSLQIGSKDLKIEEAIDSSAVDSILE